MLLMAWRIIQGMEVREIRMNYQRQKALALRVVLESVGERADEPYVSRNMHDFALFRHVGTLDVGGAPLFDGFYALRVRGIGS
jgi:hypothetical protein